MFTAYWFLVHVSFIQRNSSNESTVSKSTVQCFPCTVFLKKIKHIVYICIYSSKNTQAGLLFSENKRTLPFKQSSSGQTSARDKSRDFPVRFGLQEGAGIRPRVLLVSVPVCQPNTQDLSKAEEKSDPSDETQHLPSVLLDLSCTGGTGAVMKAGLHGGETRKYTKTGLL